MGFLVAWLFLTPASWVTIDESRSFSWITAHHSWATATASEGGYFRTADGVKLRWALWNGAANHNRNVTIILLQGRAAFIEKNIDFITDLTLLGFKVFTFDWRGMGGSGRVLEHSQKNHIDSFDTYVKDLDQMLMHVVHPRTRHHKLVFLGVSLGGHLALRYLHDYPGKVHGAILAAPMLDIVTDPFPHWLTEPMVKVICGLGFGESYAFGHGDFDPVKADFAHNQETQDPKRFQKMMEAIRHWPQYVIGGPTFGWVKAAFDSIQKTRDPEYMQKITQPVLMFTAGKDRIVLTNQDSAICQMMPRCSHKLYGDAFHNLLQEIEPIRGAFLAETNRFIAEVIER